MIPPKVWMHKSKMPNAYKRSASFLHRFVPPRRSTFTPGKRSALGGTPVKPLPLVKQNHPYAKPHPENLLPPLVKQSRPLQYHCRRTQPSKCKTAPENRLCIRKVITSSNKTLQIKNGGAPAQPLRQISALCSAHLRNPYGRSLHFARRTCALEG